jgi:hypothetical protein
MHIAWLFVLSNYFLLMQHVDGPDVLWGEDNILISEEMSGLPFHENSSKKQMILFLAIL